MLEPLDVAWKTIEYYGADQELNNTTLKATKYDDDGARFWELRRFLPALGYTTDTKHSDTYKIIRNLKPLFKDFCETNSLVFTEEFHYSMKAGPFNNIPLSKCVAEFEVSSILFIWLLASARSHRLITIIK